MDGQPSENISPGSIGWGVVGCAGGLGLGLVGGGLLLILLSLVIALTSSVAPVTAAVNAVPDLRLTFSENFLSRVIQDSTAEAVSVDILPGNQFKLLVNTSVTVLGASLPVQITGLFQLQLVNQTLEVRLLDTQVSGFELPQELTGFFNDTLPLINQDINRALQELATGLGTPIILTGLGTDQTTLWLEAREAP